MKKFISILLLMTLVLSCCACGQKSEQAQNTEPSTLDPASPEALYGHIDQNTPVEGLYKIWNAEGVKAMASHPEGSFEILCNIDMQGATLAPIGTEDMPFTGTINGANYVISNFTVAGEAAGLGFVGVGSGKLTDVRLENVTVTANAACRYIGTLAGSFDGTIQRCYVSGALTVENAAENALCGSLVGKAIGTVANCEANVDLCYTAPGAATVSGIAGSMEGGKLEHVQTNGAITLTGSNKVAGLFAGSAKDVQASSLVFVGADNSLDGQLFTNYFGTEENVTWETMLVRDNSRAPEKPHIQEKREKAVQYMYDMATTEWHVKEDFTHSCNCSISACYGTFLADYTFYGPPYNHKASSLYRMHYALDENGYLKDFVTDGGAYDGYDMYVGSDCSAATALAFQTVSSTVHYTQTQDEVPFYRHGTYPVGDYVYDLDLDPTSQAMITKKYTDHNGPEVMYNAYAQLRMGDSVVYWIDGAGHSRLCASDAVVVRDEFGKINGNYSYVKTHEQGVINMDTDAKTYTSWGVNYTYTFDNLYTHYYLPVTVKEFITGEFETPTCTLEGGIQDSRAGLTTGTITSNYAIDYVNMVITDEKGNEVFNHIMFPSVSKAGVDGGTHSRTRYPNKYYDLISFGPALQTMGFEKGKTYHATVTTTLMTGDSFVVSDFSFTNG